MLTNHIDAALDVGQRVWSRLCHVLTSHTAGCAAEATRALTTWLGCGSGQRTRRVTMKAMVCEAFGGPEVLAWRDLPDPPPPGKGEIQVRIRARGVQYVDVLMLAGKYQFRPDPPFIPGGEAAGEVIAVGPDVTGFEPGQRVMSRHTLGACAELGNAK